jgi:esterase/lipase superfamily enzyme
MLVGDDVAYRIHPLTAAAIALAICCCACAGRPQEGTLIPVAAADTEGASRVGVLVATTRQRATADVGDMFSGERADQVSYAAVTISIPPDAGRKIGDVQWPTSLPANPQKDFATIAANYLDKQSFAAALTAEAKQTKRSKVLVFVHGFNNRFDEAVYRFAQIVHDSKAPGIPVLFSWPSRGVLALRAYRDDVESAKSSRDALLQLLDMIASNANVKEVNVLCHSMGCIPTLEALWSMSSASGTVRDKIKNVLLVAPDVDVNAFHRQIQQMGRTKPRLALFFSQDDQALKLSKSIWGGATRLGDIDPDQEPYKSDFKQAGIQVFDLTALRGNPHSRAFEDVTSVMGMIERRLAQGQQMTDDRPNGLTAVNDSLGRD